jgi:hypothetical protein
MVEKTGIYNRLCGKSDDFILNDKPHNTYHIKEFCQQFPEVKGRKGRQGFSRTVRYGKSK